MIKTTELGSTASAQFPQTQRRVLFYARAHAVFYTRVALMILYLFLLAVPAWHNIIPVDNKYTLPVFIFVLLYCYCANGFKCLIRVLSAQILPDCFDG